MANLNSSIVNGFLRVTGKLKVNSLEIESNELVSNLNADLLDGKQGSEYASSTDVESLTTQVNTNTGNILTNLEKIQANTEQIGTNKNDISTLKSRMTAAEGNITTNTGDISNLKTKTDTTNTNVANNTSRIDSILAGTAEIPSVGNADHANDSDKLGGQLPAYYAKATDLTKYLPLDGNKIVDKQVTFKGSTTDKKAIRTNGILGIASDGTTEAPLYINQGSSQPVYINNTTNLVYHSGNIPSASTSVKGIVQLNNTYTSTSTTLAPTANALKSAYDTVNGALTTHKNDTNVHLSTTDRAILTKANKFKGYYETETALNTAHPTGEAGDYAIVNTTDTVWIWDADKEGGAGWKDGAGKGSVISVNNMTGEVVLTKSNIGLGNVDNTSDANKPVSTAQQAALDKKVNKAGDTMTGDLTLQSKLIIQGTNTTNSSRYISSDNSSNIFFVTNNVARVVIEDNVFRPSTSLKGQVNLGTDTNRFKDLYLAGVAKITGVVTTGADINSGASVNATTYLKTGSGVVNFKDKVNVQYNSTDECIEFIFN